MDARLRDCETARRTKTRRPEVSCPEVSKSKKYTTMEKKEPQVRYSDEELEEFRALILEKLAQAKANLETLKANLSGGEPACPPCRGW